MSREAFRLTPSFREKIWGVTALEPWFRATGERIGEVWFLAPDGSHLPILVKFIFTADRLSVQVHPSDSYAMERDGIPGKTEMWHILQAEPGARLALGFRETITRERLREASLSGEIEALLAWFPVSAGQTYLIPPGTVHALGPGITLCEIQENSDITYRLYDYGRPRELHLDKAVDVSELGPHPGPSEPENGVLARCDYFVTERIVVEKPYQCEPDPERFRLLVVLAGTGRLAGHQFALGEVWMIPAGTGPFTLVPDSRTELLRTWVPRTV